MDRLAFYKINEFQLYIEHTFAFEGMSEVWGDKDPLTAEDVLILDAYCKERHIEMIPSLSTFGHLYEVLRTHSFTELCELENVRGEPYLCTGRNHTLNPTDKRSITLVKNMLQQFMPYAKAYPDDLEGFILSARGIQLMDAFCLAILKFEGGLNETKQIYAPPVLAAQLEEWFVDYSAAWRMKNKESELNRIREVIQYLCDYLRRSIY